MEIPEIDPDPETAPRPEDEIADVARATPEVLDDETTAEAAPGETSAYREAATGFPDVRGA